MAKKKSKKGKYKKAKKIVLGVLMAYVLILVLAYAGGVVYFSKHFFSGSKINGLDSAGKTVKEVERDMASQIASYELVIKEREDKTETISAAKIGMQYVDDGKIKELKKQQNPFTWFLSFIHAKDYTMSATTTYDEAAVKAAVDQLAVVQDENMVKPVNAHLEVTENGYEIIPETMGTEVDKEKVKSVVLDAIERGASEVNLEEAGCYTSPEILSTDEKLMKQQEEGNKFLNVTVTIDFADRQEVVNKDVMKDWLVVGEDGSLDLSHEKAKAYVQELKYEYDTFGSSRQFTTAYGETITVSGGDYGWVIAPNDTTTKILDAIKSGESQTITPEYTYSAYRREKDEIGNTYVEISLSRQHMWFFKDGQLLVSTDIVTGNHNRGWDTHTGVYAIMYKERDATLVGEGYNSSVTYWMPFYANTGIHDATWRSSFGGSIYMNNGSHGCINTPYDQAEKIFNNIEKGVPVVVYN
nr:peptidoglycan binding domain-containing protein [uncultured Blautia sp.]